MRSSKSFLDFVIKIDPNGDGSYRAEAQGPTGEAETNFRLPFDDKDITIFLLEVRQQRRTPSRGRIPEPLQNTITFGTKLFNAVLQGDVRDLFARSRQAALERGVGLRIQLRLQHASELLDLPWEFLSDGRNFIALSNDTPVIHYLDLPNPPRPLTVNLPLRILVTVSSTRDRDLPILDVNEEQERIRTALGKLERLIQIDFTPDASLKTIQHVLRTAWRAGKPYHIWHFIGHGGFDPVNQAGVLVLSDEKGISSLVNGLQLGVLFENYPDIRLILLNSCEGARPSRSDPFSSVAAALIDKGIPAVIGMQFEISDSAAIAFSEEFYAAVADGLPVDVAITQARQAVLFIPNWVEWATPVLFMRAPNGILFEFQPELLGVGQPEVPKTPPPRKEEVAHQVKIPKRIIAISMVILAVVLFLAVFVFLNWRQKVASENERERTQTAIAAFEEATSIAYVGEMRNAETQIAIASKTTDALVQIETIVAKTKTAEAVLPPVITPNIVSPTALTPPTEIGPEAVLQVLIPAGPFSMGSDKGKKDERPKHTVVVDEFSMDVYEVNNSLFIEFLKEYGNQVEGGATWLDADDEDSRIKRDKGEWVIASGYEDHPVVEVTWYGAQAYCKSAGKRLPTEAEWEKAARGGLEGKLYPWGDDLPVCDAKVFNGAQFEPCFDSTITVGSFAPNNFGLYDMAGNVWEWVSDWYLEDYYESLPPYFKNPQGPPKGKYRVARGGGWWQFNNADLLRVAWRDSGVPADSFAHFGFRCAMDP